MGGDNPYRRLPEFTRWSKVVAAPAYPDVDPAVGFPFQIGRDDKVATGGSCFAQHIARHLKAHGFNYYVMERGHKLGNNQLRAEYNYGTFSARYGNIYTARQLLQLLRRCLGQFQPAEPAWSGEGVVDPFRPTIEPGGFASLAEMEGDRVQHLRRVRQMFETLDVFVSTLGLTEYWYAREDHAVLPVCPGVSGGVFDERRYGFANQSVFEVVDDLGRFLDLLRSVNRNAKVVLTVSPVPLVATGEKRHVLVSTTASKSVLRTACEEIVRRNRHVAYFPSYEVVTGAYTRGRYFAEDLRSVTEEGVAHVMRLFLRHAAHVETDVPPPIVPDDTGQEAIKRMQAAIAVSCEEELIEASYSVAR